MQLSDGSGSRRALAAIAALTGIALLMRLYRLDEGLWLDEITTWVRYMRLPLSEIPMLYGTENQHFLFSLLARLSMNVFGESVWAFRLPAALFGAASIWAMYLFGAEAADRKQGLLGAALLTFSYQHVWFSQNARGYAGLLFWTLMASWLLLRALREQRTGLWCAYAVAAALGVYTHATMAFVLIGHALIAAWQTRGQRAWRGTALGFGLAFTLTVLLHAPAMASIFSGVKHTVSVVQEWKSPLWTVLELARGLRIGYAGAAAGVLALTLFLAGAWSYWRTRPAVVALLVLPPVIGSSILLAMGHHIWPRFFYFAMGFGALIVIRGALLIPRAGTAIAFAIIAVSAASVPFAYGPKQDFGSARQYVLSQLQPGDRVATSDLSTWVYGQFYHAGWIEVHNAAELAALRAPAGRTWFLYTLEPVFRSISPEVHEAVGREFRIVKVFPGTLKNGEVTVCVRDAAGGAPAQ
ncbi:MAG: glycosyltransferase family 39 protein [Bryobacterales bacterium]|nr:glycosyltransferase family 39 protein [Bryobacterales bacterium]